MKKTVDKKTDSAKTSSNKIVELLTVDLTDHPTTENFLNLLIGMEILGVAKLDNFSEQLAYFNNEFDEAIRPEKGRQSNQQKIDEQKLNWLVRATEFYGDPNGALKKYQGKELRDRRISEIKRDANSLSKAELVSKYSDLVIENELINQQLGALKNEKEHHLASLIGKLATRKKSVSNQTEGLKKKYSSNNQCMKECLTEVLNSGAEDKQLSKGTYRKFCNLVRRKFPKPPVTQKPRQTKLEKLQDPKIQKADLEAMERKEWAPSTLWAFFEKSLKVKIVDLPENNLST